MYRMLDLDRDGRLSVGETRLVFHPLVAETNGFTGASYGSGLTPSIGTVR